MQEKLHRVNVIDGLRFIDGDVRRIELSKPVADAALAGLFQILRDDELEFAVYDACYPSPSDPGAYFSYSSRGAAVGTWRMTLGNHGWGGGVYVVDQAAVCCQLRNLTNRGLIRDIQLDRVGFFAHYSLEGAPRSREMNERLQTIHGGAS
jgi:hypothetical protein